MTRERIKDFKKIILPFFTNYLLKENYDNLGKSYAVDFAEDFSEILELADKALEKEPGKGHWIDHSDEGYVEFPICGSATNCDDNISDLHFCFSCGTKMDEELEAIT